DVIVYDALANPSLLAGAKPDAELIYVGKVSDQHSLPQDQINETLALKASEGKKVVRLKGGDPYIFGRGGEEAEFLVARGLEFEEIPGVTSAIAAPAYAGIPLTHRDLTSSLTILTGHEKFKTAGSAHNWKALAQSGSTLVIVMGMANLGEIVQNLVAGGLDASTPAAVIYKGTTPAQRAVYAELGKIESAAKDAALTNPSVIVVGKVVSLHEKLDWRSTLPLLGKTIIVTRAREQASDLARGLAKLGAAIIECPAIKIEPLTDYSKADAAIKNIAEYQWIIFTSANGVKYFWQRLNSEGLDSRALWRAKIVAIGPGTADALLKNGVIADFIPSSFVAEEVANQLIGQEGAALANQKVLIPRAAKARSVLPDELSAADMIVDVVPVYETVAGEGCGDDIAKLIEEGRVDCATFGSSSSVANFLDIVSVDALKAASGLALAAIGPITARALSDKGLSATIQPDQYTIPALIKAIAQYYSGKK
ncbi:MAG: uroporphyrinogen-III C-methyltransferase, partial [Desulfovibrio sp.]|nr:uroporphyrinogen-III C-methyltransferase [Desulfovibrio sp.]